jgi:predicted ATPase
MDIRESLSPQAEREVGTRRELAQLYLLLGQDAVVRRDIPGARKFIDLGFAICLALTGENPDDMHILRDVYRSITELGHISLMEINDPATAKDH